MKPSTLLKIKIRVADLATKVKNNNGDEEDWHTIEDGIWEDALKAIANGDNDAQEIAAAALKTNQINFSRWYA